MFVRGLVYRILLHVGHSESYQTYSRRPRIDVLTTIGCVLNTVSALSISTMFMNTEDLVYVCYQHRSVELIFSYCTYAGA